MRDIEYIMYRDYIEENGIATEGVKAAAQDMLGKVLLFIDQLIINLRKFFAEYDRGKTLYTTSEIKSKSDALDRAMDKMRSLPDVEADDYFQKLDEVDEEIDKASKDLFDAMEKATKSDLKINSGQLVTAIQSRLDSLLDTKRKLAQLKSRQDDEDAEDLIKKYKKKVEIENRFIAHKFRMLKFTMGKKSASTDNSKKEEKK